MEKVKEAFIHSGEKDIDEKDETKKLRALKVTAQSKMNDASLATFIPSF